jgi:hypothetical protein
MGRTCNIPGGSKTVWVETPTHLRNSAANGGNNIKKYMNRDFKMYDTTGILQTLSVCIRIKFFKELQTLSSKYII